jgi:transposase
MPPTRSVRAPPAWRAPVRPPIRRRNHEIDPFTRTKLVELKKVAGWTYKQIHAQYRSIPISTIKSTVARESKRIDNQSMQRSGRPRKLDSEDKEKLLTTIDDNPRVTYDDLLATVDHKVKRHSIWRLLAEEGRRKWLVLDRPALTPWHAQKRLEWAQTYAGYTPLEFARVFWSDECTVERGIGERREYTFNRPKDQIPERDVRGLPTKGKQIKQMFWAAFSGSTRRTGLIPLFGNPESARGGVDRFVIRDLYMRVLPTLLANQDAIFQHDNASTHTAYVVREALDELGIEVMEWPARSPDLSPIENLWALLKDKLYKLHPELKAMPNNDATHAYMIDCAQESWSVLDLDVMRHLSETMPHRVQAIIEAEGWYTSY